MERCLLSCVTQQRRGFSLIELLVVIALIGLLAGLLIPAVGSVRQQAQITRAGHDMRQILIAWSAEQRAGAREFDSVDSVHAWALVLARRQNLNDARIYLVGSDPALQGAGIEPRWVGQPGETGLWQLDSRFANTTLSIVVAQGVSPSRHPPSTPVIWSRGLGPDGKWASIKSSEPGVFGSSGGFIAFLDGRVEFFEDLAEGGGQLLDYQSRRPTADIRKALPPGARILPESSLNQKSLNL